MAYISMAVLWTLAVYMSIGALSWIVYMLFIRPYLSPLRKIPGLPYWPVVGNSFAVTRWDGRDFELHINKLTRLARRLGPVFRFYEILGAARLYVTDPSVMKQMLVTRAANYVKPKHPIVQGLKAVIGEGLVILEGADHATHKRLISPSFNNAAIKRMVGVFEAAGRRLAARWGQQVASSQQHVQVQLELSRLTLDVIGRVAFGYDLGAVERPDARVTKAFQQVLEGDIVPWRIMIPGYLRLPFSDSLRLKRAVAIMFDKVAEIIAAKQRLLEQGGKGASEVTGDILGIMMLARDEETGQGLSDAELQNEVMTIMAAGHETTSTGMSWFLYCMAQHPEVQRKVREEVRQVLPEADTPITWEMLDKLHYLGLCIKECLRLYPPVPVTIRMPLEDDCFLGQYHIPAGTYCVLGMGSMMRSPELFEDPDTFRPERFDSSDAENRNMFRFLPFLIGPRMCLGHKFALIEMKVILACLLRKLHFESIPGLKFRPSTKNRITMRPAPPLVLHGTLT